MSGTRPSFTPAIIHEDPKALPSYTREKLHDADDLVIRDTLAGQARANSPSQPSPLTLPLPRPLLTWVIAHCQIWCYSDESRQVVCATVLLPQDSVLMRQKSTVLRLTVSLPHKHENAPPPPIPFNLDNKRGPTPPILEGTRAPSPSCHSGPGTVPT